MSTQKSIGNVVIPEDRVFVHQGVERLKMKVIVLEPEVRLMDFDEAKTIIESMPVDTQAKRYHRQGNLDALFSVQPKVRAYAGNGRGENRRLMHPAKMYITLHSALFVRSLEWLAADRRDPAIDNYPTQDDYRQYPILKEWIATSDAHHNSKRECDGIVVLSTCKLKEFVGWDEDVLGAIDIGKLSTRLDLVARLDYVPWKSTCDVDLELLTMKSAAQRLGMVVPDGVILVTEAAARLLKYRHPYYDGHHASVVDGDKLRGAFPIPLKGTVQIIPGDHPSMILTEGGSLKIKLGENGDRIIRLTAQEIMGSIGPGSAFAVETPSLERVLQSPKFAFHMRELQVGPLWEENPGRARGLLPQLSPELIALASGVAPVLDYVELCVYPVQDQELDYQKVRMACMGMLEGHVPIPRNEEIPGLMTVNDLSFGITTMGSLMLHGVKPTFEPVWEHLSPRIGKRIIQTMYPRVQGTGGMLQGDDSLPYGVMDVSPIIWKKLGLGNTLLNPEGAVIYWPRKTPLCLHKVRIAVNRKLKGSVLRLNSRLLKAMGGDSDGDNLLITVDEQIVGSALDVQKEYTHVDPTTGEILQFPDLVTLVECAWEEASGKIRQETEYLESVRAPIDDAHIRQAITDDGVKTIGMAFNWMDVVASTIGWNDLYRMTMAGRLCHEALSGLKVTAPTNTVQSIIRSGRATSQYLNFPMAKLPYVESGKPLWVGKDKDVDFRNTYDVVRGIHHEVENIIEVAQRTRNAGNLFEFILRNSGLEHVRLPKLVTPEDLRAKEQGIHCSNSDLSDARFFLAQSAKEEYVLDGVKTKATSLPRYRLKSLLDKGVDQFALVKAVYQHVTKTKNYFPMGLLFHLRMHIRRQEELVAPQMQLLLPPSEEAVPYNPLILLDLEKGRYHTIDCPEASLDCVYSPVFALTVESPCPVCQSLVYLANEVRKITQFRDRLEVSAN